MRVPPAEVPHGGGGLITAPERVAVVGNRKGADMQQVVRFIEALHREQPDTIVISGGASGVDQMAESTWFRLGGRIRSYRPAPYDDGFGVEVWNYGGDTMTGWAAEHNSGAASVLPVQEQRVQFADYASACIYRDWMISEDCDRLVAFYRRGVVAFSGTATTESLAKDKGVPTYSFVATSDADAA